MIHLGLTGYPLGHSLSPKIHTAALQACGLQGDYSLFPIHPDDKHELKNLLIRIRSGKIKGLNVTIPHKQHVISLLDELTDTAKAIGAVNTIYLQNGKLMGDNTDALGFLVDLKKFLGRRESEIGKSAIVLGAGGSARAVVYALLNDNWNITISARRIEQVQQLASTFTNYELRITNLTDPQPSTLRHGFASQDRAFDLLVNATPIGMTPNIDQSPLPENLSLPQHGFIYDLVYNPRETKLVRGAHSQGLQATTGLGMLIEQAALAFEIWTGCNPSRETMRLSVE